MVTVLSTTPTNRGKMSTLVPPVLWPSLSVGQPLSPGDRAAGAREIRWDDPTRVSSTHGFTRTHPPTRFRPLTVREGT